MTGKNKVLLVVDDEVEICNFVKMFFEVRGFDVYSANDGTEGVATAEEIQPDIVLLDVHMQNDEDGLTALPKILAKSPSTKVIMTTGVDDEISMVRARQLGATDYITKPLVLEDLESNVMSRVNEQKNSH